MAATAKPPDDISHPLARSASIFTARDLDCRVMPGPRSSAGRRSQQLDRYLQMAVIAIGARARQAAAA
jgi:hypothetical protein